MATKHASHILPQDYQGFIFSSTRTQSIILLHCRQFTVNTLTKEEIFNKIDDNFGNTSITNKSKMAAAVVAMVEHHVTSVRFAFWSRISCHHLAT